MLEISKTWNFEEALLFRQEAFWAGTGGNRPVPTLPPFHNDCALHQDEPKLLTPAASDHMVWLNGVVLLEAVPDKGVHDAGSQRLRFCGQ